MARHTPFLGLAGLSVVAASLAAPGLAGGVPAAAVSASYGGTSPASTTTVQLVTGDLVQLSTTPSGRQTTQLTKALTSGPGSVFRTYQIAQRWYVVPQSAVPYLGTRLDPELFDVTRLAQHRDLSMDVVVRERAGATGQALTGLSAQHRVGHTIEGTFSATGARAFGRALARQSMRDHGSPTHTTGLFRDIARVSPAMPALPVATTVTGSANQPARAASLDSTITFTGINWAGAPDNGDSFNVYNVDDMTLFAQSISFVNGQAHLTVPDGHYSALGFFYDFSTGSIYEDTVAQFTVSGDTTVTIDARDATAPVSVTTPKPATAKSTVVVAARADAAGQVGQYFFLAGAQQFYVKPIKKAPPVGTLYFSLASRQYSAGAKLPYTFDLKYGSVGTISADQHYAPSLDSLASVDSTYAADHPDQQSIEARLPAFPWEQSIIGDNIPFTTPTHRVEYYTASKDVRWLGVEYQVYLPATVTLLGTIDSSWRHYRPGEHQVASWAADPALPRLLEQPVRPNQTVCPACLAGTTLDALVLPFSDSAADHIGSVDPPTAGLSESAHWSVLADGDVAQQGTGNLIAAAQVGSANRYEIDYDTTRSSDDFTLSTQTSTSWTIPAGAPQADLPHGWTCTLAGGTDCAVLGLMTPSVHLPSDEVGAIPSGEATATIAIGHLAGLAAKVRSLRVKVSFDGGDTYTKATVTKVSSGVYTLVFTVPPKHQTDGYGALSFSAKDDLKGTLSETVLRAFAVS